MRLKLLAVSEQAPGPKWQGLFNAHWPHYRRWFLSEGSDARPKYLQTETRIRKFMPELLPLYGRMCELAGGGDLAARFLGMYRPPFYLNGCSQAVWTDGEGFLVRNYDFSPNLFEGNIIHSRWSGKTVIAMSDCLWGVLDGVNDSGLAVSLTFGGRKITGDGFGIPLVLRYILEFCDTLNDAIEVLKSVPLHMAYNVTLLDRENRFRTVYLSPDRDPVIRQLPATTNHQGWIEWPRYAQATASLHREHFLFEQLADVNETPSGFINRFLHSPLFNMGYKKGFGTLYTAVYRPSEGIADYLWPHMSWRHALSDFDEGSRQIHFANAPDGPVTPAPV